MVLILNDDFEHKYTARQIDKLPVSGTQVQYFPSAEFKNYLVSLIVLIEPAGKRPWVGKFVSDPPMPDYAGLSGLYSCPNPRQLCVVAGGWPYIVDTQNASSRIEIDMDCILRVDACVEKRLLIFSSQNIFWAWGTDGLVWETSDLGDSIEVTKVTSDTIYGTAIRHAQSVAFEIEAVSINGQSWIKLGPIILHLR